MKLFSFIASVYSGECHVRQNGLLPFDVSLSSRFEFHPAVLRVAAAEANTPALKRPHLHESGHFNCAVGSNI